VSENKKLSALRGKAMKLPLTPGVYIMKNKEGKIIYIGKAKKLKNRVSQYFGSQNGHSTKVRKMVENVDDFDYILTDSEFEALVLECSLIKQNMPKYNILLKDDKGYSYIKITKGPWGKISPCFRKDDPDAEYLGPYTGNYSVTNACARAAEIFRLPTCNKVFPRDIKSGRPCLNYFISRCSAPCAGKISEAEYEENLKSAVAFLKNPGASVVRELREEMEEAAENLDFEKAAKLRDRIKAIERITQKQKVVVNSEGDEDVFAIAQRGNKACLSVLSFEQGALKNSEYFIFDTGENLADERQSLITSYYSLDRKIPALIIADGEVSDSELITEWLSEKRGKKVTLLVPQRGEKVKLTQMCLTNAAQKLSEHLGFFGADTAVLDELKKLLGLKKTPEYIEAYDISHTAGSDNVAGMVVFKNARPMRSAYKRFSIKTFSGQDDYGSMRQVLTRRFTDYIHSEKGFEQRPDLLLIDGGVTHTGVALQVLNEFGLDTPVFGMVKEDRHRTRALVTADGKQIRIDHQQSVFSFIGTIQEETHRFAITYHRKLRSKRLKKSVLDEIPGIGPKRKELLLKRFSSVSAIKQATVQELEHYLPANAAWAVYSHFHQSEG